MLNCCINAAVVIRIRGIAVSVFGITIENVVVIAIFHLLGRRWDLIACSLHVPDNNGHGIGVLR